MKKGLFFLLFIFAISLQPFLLAEDIPKEVVCSNPRVNLFLVGTGVVGEELLNQIDTNHAFFMQTYGVDLRVVGLANSRQMFFSREGIDLSAWRLLLEEQGQPMNWAEYSQQLEQFAEKNTVFIDCTSSLAVANTYGAILSSTVSVVTPNKKANSSRYGYYQELKALSCVSKASYHYEANVGAGLPMITTLRGLIQSGDSSIQLEGVLSGTLSFIFNSFQDGVRFSEVIKEAQKRGYTEPNPIDDLSGMDVARKLLILCREAGYSFEMEDIELQRFLPDECYEAASLEEFYSKLESYDDVLTSMRKEAEAQGKKLRMIASLDGGKAKVGLQAVGVEHPFYTLSNCDNALLFRSKYYQNPLVIQGPGAGREVTAARVLDGIIQAAIKSRKALINVVAD